MKTLLSAGAAGLFLFATPAMAQNCDLFARRWIALDHEVRHIPHCDDGVSGIPWADNYEHVVTWCNSAAANQRDEQLDELRERERDCLRRAGGKR